jgi:hypothetical protein
MLFKSLRNHRHPRTIADIEDAVQLRTLSTGNLTMCDRLLDMILK